MAKLIGTAGHVDHGKTTLIRALTGIDADRLPEEKERGMTIDIGFAYIDFPQLGRVSIVDVPGHERFLRNMLVGALGIDVALLCVAADEGVKPQTVEHLEILELLPVNRMVVALTRADLADAETRELATMEVADLLEGTRFQGCPVVEVSAEAGEGLEKLKSELEGALASETTRRDGPWYLPIDRAFSVKGHGCVVTGTLAQGTVRVGDRAFIEPGHLEVRVRSIQSHGESAEASEFGKRTALNLGGVHLEALRRGQSVGATDALFETRVLDARMQWSSPPKHAQRVRVSIGADEAIAKVFLSDADASVAQFRIEEPVACAKGQPLVVRKYSPPELLGAGQVLVPQAKPRRKKDAPAVPTDRGSDGEAILELLGTNASGVGTDEICRSLGRTQQQLGPTFEGLTREGKAIGFAGLWFSAAGFDAGESAFREALRELHSRSPQAAGIPRERVIEAAKVGWTGKPLDRILSHLAAASKIEIAGTMVKDPSFQVQLSPKQRAFLDRVIGEFERAGINSPSPLDLARSLVVPPQAIEEILKVGIQAGEIVRVADGIYYSRGQLDAIRSKISELFGANPFTAAEFRDAMGSSRKYAVPLLEHFDAIGFTLRLGDKRVVK